MYALLKTTQLPPQKAVLSVSFNKVQLIDLIQDDLTAHAEDLESHKLVITGSGAVPVEVNDGIIIEC